MKHTMKVCLPLILLSAGTVCADTTLTCGRAALRLSDNAVPLSLVLTADGTDCLNRFYREPLAEVQTSDGAWHPAASLKSSDKTLVLGFRDIDTTLTLAVDTQPDWIALRVVSFGGTRPAATRFVELNSTFTEIVGKRLNIGWNKDHALCVMATSPLTDTQVAGQTSVTLEETVAAVNRGEAGVNPRVRLTAQVSDAPGPKMEGASAVIIACATPDFKKVARSVSHAYGLLTNETTDGTPVKDTEAVRASSFVIDAGLRDADRLIRTCEATGIRQVMLPTSSWCSSVGHSAINTNNFPNGLEDLKAFVARLKAAGITVGMHCSAKGGNQETSLSDIFNTCGFGMVYFDGATAQFQDHAMRQFNRPVIHTGTLMTQHLWHSLARNSTADTYLNTFGGAVSAGKPSEKGLTVKQSIDAHVVDLLSQRGDMMPGELDGFGVWPRQQRHGREIEGLQLDEMEYLLSRSIAYDWPVSLQTSFRELDRNPLTPDILRLIKAYETARMARHFTEAEKAPMREPGKEFTLLLRKGFPPAWVPARAVPCGTSHNVHAMVGTYLQGGSFATFWHAVGKANVTLEVPLFTTRIADFDDQRVVALKSKDEKLILPVGTRRLTVYCPTLDAATLEQRVRNSLSTETPSGL